MESATLVALQLSEMFLIIDKLECGAKVEHQEKSVSTDLLASSVTSDQTNFYLVCSESRS